MPADRVMQMWLRAREMDRHELLDRCRQHFGKRLDAVRHRFQHDFATGELNPTANTSPRFFFQPDEVPSRLALLRQRFPEEAKQIVQRAERICRHRFDLLGYEDLHFGPKIDWHSDPVHNKRAPSKAAYKIHYLDFAEVGDSKIIWELNRHQHLVLLAKAYRLTSEEKFATEIFRQWDDWNASNPYPIGVNWASSLEVAMRSLSWLWAYYLMAGTSAIPPGFHQSWLRAIALSGRHLERYLSTYFSPNTHLLGEGVGLFFIGTLCPELRSAERWKQRGWNIVLRAAEAQVQADGLHFEQSVYYHVYALDFFLHAAALASINDVPIPPAFERTLEKMLDALCVLGRAGAPPRLGDDDGGRLFDPRRNRAEHMLDPLATGAVLCGRGDFKSVAGGLREETVWLLGEQGVAEFDRLPVKEPVQGSVALQSGGLYVMAGARQQLVIDAGPQGALSAGHGHADALSVSAHSNGRALLIDPGTFEYAGDGSARNEFRGTRAHNTLVVDGLDQAEPKGAFGWKNLPAIKAEGWISGEMFDLFVGSHDGYSRLERPVVHRRWVFSLKPYFWLVRDMALGTGEHQLDLFWHLSPELAMRGREANTFLDADSRTGIQLVIAEKNGWSQDMRKEWWSPAYGRKERLYLQHFGTVATLPAEFVTLLVPVRDGKVSQGTLTQIKESAAKGMVTGYRYSTPEADHLLFFAEPGKEWTLGPWRTNAEFLYSGNSRGRRTLICCNATYAEARGQRVISSVKPVMRCEIAGADDQVNVFSSSKEAWVNQEAFRNLSTEVEPVLTSSLPASGRTES